MMMMFFTTGGIDDKNESSLNIIHKINKRKGAKKKLFKQYEIAD